MSEILPPREIWEITNVSSLDPLPWADIPSLDGVIKAGETKNALEYTTADILGASDVYRNYMTRYPPKITSPGYLHTHDDRASVDHTHDGLDVLTGGPESDADALHSHPSIIIPEDYVDQTDLQEYVRKDGSISQLSDITSTGNAVENAVTMAHEESHTILEHTDGSDPFTIANLQKLFDGSNADCLHVHSDITGIEHNNLDGLNEGDYIHLTAAEYANLDTSGAATGIHNDLDGLQGGGTDNPSWGDEYYHLIYDEYNKLTNDLSADGLHFHNATAIVYDNATYPTVDAALDNLLYVAPNIASFTHDQSVIEIGNDVTVTNLSWSVTLGSAALTSQSLNQGIGEVGTAATSYEHTDTYGESTGLTNSNDSRTYTLTVTDGTTPDNANAIVYFRHKRYWGTSTNTSLTDGQIIALSKEFGTSRSMSKTISPSGEYIYFAWPASWDSSPPATFTVNGLNNTAWTLVTRDFDNASGWTESYRIYRSDNLLTGSYDIVVS